MKQTYAFTELSTSNNGLVKFLQVFKTENDKTKICIRNSEGVINEIEITSDEALNLSIALTGEM